MTEDRLLLPGEVARKFRVNPKTVSRWAQDGLIPCIMTPGGHRRFKESDVRRFLEKNGRGEPTNDFDALKPDGQGVGGVQAVTPGGQSYG